MSLMSAAMARAVARVYALQGEPATYTDRNSVVTPCTVLVDTDMTRYGDVATVNRRTAVVSVQVTDVAAPPRNGERFTLTETGKVWPVDTLQVSDEFEHRSFAA